MNVKITADIRQAIAALSAVEQPPLPWCIYRFPDHNVGDDVHAAINAWLDANDIPADNTPKEARFAIFRGSDNRPAVVQIEQFDMDVTIGSRTISLRGSEYVKTERIFDLKAPITGFEPVETGRI